MAETKIKIVSNPYEEQVSFFKFNGTDWIDINPASRLFNDKLSHGFFPFKAEEIVATILKEFGNGEKIELLFQGADDEWIELEAICADDAYSDKVSAERAATRLSNARDILPEIIEVFSDIKPLVNESSVSSDVAKQIDKFTDVSSDIIPLCVMGNYSAGKSTFINALVGMEILPNGDEPVTARVFQIKRSKDRDRATIKFDCGDNTYTLRFDPNGLMEDSELTGVALYDKISSKITESSRDMSTAMNSALKVLNAYRPVDGEGIISDLIRIVVPFAESDPWPHDREFVIFDTPGSNSASNTDHAAVLSKAMHGLSNGLPVFVAEYSSLDTKDNEKLYREIEQISEIDERFAMIVVNKADSADLPKGGFDQDEIDQIMSWAIPRNLYGQGIYFISSILGLGAKTNGEFMSDNYAEKFEDQQRKYVDPTSRFYKTLYRYNILPGQINRRTNRESEACENLLLANSGLFCVENEIRLFAERYSAYNKCSRSENLLQQIIKATENELNRVRDMIDKEKAEREKALDDDKNRLIKALESAGTASQEQATLQYSPAIDAAFNPHQWDINVEALTRRQQALTDEKKEDLNFSGRETEASDALSSILPNLMSKMASSVQDDGTSSLKDRAEKLAKGIKGATQGLVGDTQDAIKKQTEVTGASKQADRNAADQLFDEVVKNYSGAAEHIAATVEECSQRYWKDHAEQCRAELYSIATDDSAPLSDKKRKEIGDLIIRYQSLALAKCDNAVFDKADFNEIRWNNHVIVKSDKLFLNKVERVYNDRIARCLADTRSQIDFVHTRAFGGWLNELLHQIISNLTDYNPVLREHVEEISKKAIELNSLEAKLAKLKDRKDYVARVIDWKE